MRQFGFFRPHRHLINRRLKFQGHRTDKANAQRRQRSNPRHRAQPDVHNCTANLRQEMDRGNSVGNVLTSLPAYAAAICGSAFVVPSACAKVACAAMTTRWPADWGQASQSSRANAIAPGPFPTEGACRGSCLQTIRRALQGNRIP